MSKARSSDPPAGITDQYAHLLSLAAHEFRTPASVVGGYLRMLQKDTEAPFSERHRKMIDEAAKSCARLVALVSELSEIGKLDNQSAPVHTETFDLFVDLERVATTPPDAEERGVRLHLSGAPAGAMLTGDRQRLLAACGACFNALLREQATALTLVAERRLVVADTGTTAMVIIAKDSEVEHALEAPRLPFDEFRGGLGLTLPMARRVIERAGGQIWSPASGDAAARGQRGAAVIAIPLQP